MGDSSFQQSLRHGQIHWVDWEPARGTEQRVRRPGLVVQADPINAGRTYGNTIVVALTTTDHGVPTHVCLDPDPSDGLAQTSFAMCEHVMTIARDRLRAYVGTANDAAMARIDRALKRALALT